MRYTIKTLLLGDSLLYAALSYTWGTLKLMKSIILNGATFLITENLDDALRHLELEDGSEGLWVNAICINQEDHAEKNERVQQMRSIFCTAAKVEVWLGLASDNSDLIMDMLSGDKWPESQSDERLLKLKRIFDQFMDKAGPLNLINAYNSFTERRW
jgi:hypothetical protein